MSDFKTKTELRGLINLTRFLRYTRPVRKRLGLSLGVDGLYETVDKMDSFLKTTSEFNATFAERGWIMHGWLNSTAADQALEIARSQDLDSAEEVLVDSISPDAVRVHLMPMRNLGCFKKRGKLALLAADDYEAGRYHASVPIVLALLDGMGQELTGAGFLRQGARFVDDDSFLDIGPGFAQLVRVLTQSRGGTSTEELRIPYRHGILHGVDLNYANKLVAAKGWNALFAAGYYAEAEEERRKPSEERVSLVESFVQLGETRKRTEEANRLMDEWEPRHPNAVSLVPQDAQPGTPEESLKEFLEHWQRPKPNYGGMARLIKLEDEPTSSMAGRLRTNLPDPPHSVMITGLDGETPGAVWLNCEAVWEDYRENVRLRMLYLGENGPLPSNSGSGKWLFLDMWSWEAAGHSYRASRQSRDD